jgi:DNA-binding winged helix-turn-helix (wHTH) protein
MGSRLGDRPCYVFGEYRLDSNRCVIETLAGERRLLLPPRVFDVALYFVRHPGLLLSKDRLLAELWPGTAVEENSLTQAISLLRHALGESRGDNHYILTVPRRGYRFVADVFRTDCRASERPAGGLTVEVLEFDYWSTLHDDARLAAGIAESIRHRLAGASAFRLVTPPAPGHAREGGRSPDAHFRIEGSLQRAGQWLRITARLVDSTDNTLIWSQIFDCATDGLFDMEDRVARGVASAVRRHVVPAAPFSTWQPGAPA